VPDRPVPAQAQAQAQAVTASSWSAARSRAGQEPCWSGAVLLGADAPGGETPWASVRSCPGDLVEQGFETLVDRSETQVKILVRP